MAVPARIVGARAMEATDGATTGHALGLYVQASFAFSGLRGASGADDDRRVRLDVVSQAEIEAAWPDAATGELPGTATRHGGAGVRTEHHHEAGYLISAPGCGRHLVDLDGRRIRTATAGTAPERWQGLLAGQALPLAAILQGLEVFSASAVVVAGQVMALAGPSGAGKSAVAARLMLVGARFFADDAIALDVRGQEIVAHAGVGLVRLGERGRAAVPHLTAQGANVIGRDGKTLVELSRDVPTLPLRSLYLLSSVTENANPDITPQLPDPFRLLAMTHNRSVRTPERLRRQLELVGLLGARVRIFSAPMARGGERELARAIFAHAALEVLL